MIKLYIIYIAEYRSRRFWKLTTKKWVTTLAERIDTEKKKEIHDW